jgi:hypothetical protein
MNEIKAIIRRKPLYVSVLSLVFTVGLILIKWNIHPTVVTLLFFGGAVIGYFMLDFAEVFLKLTPSPFESVIFCAGFTAVSLFIITSSGSAVASGLVLIMYLTLIVRLIHYWKQNGNLNNWFQMLSDPIPQKNQLYILIIFIFIFCLESFIYLR